MLPYYNNLTLTILYKVERARLSIGFTVVIDIITTFHDL